MKAEFKWIQDIREHPEHYIKMFGTRQITNELGLANHWNDCDEWLLVVQGETLLGFSGYENKNQVFILKRAYVFPEYRGFGIYKQMIDFRIRKAIELGVNVVQCTATRMSMREFEKRGFKAIKNYKKFVTYRQIL